MIETFDYQNLAHALPPPPSPPAPPKPPPPGLKHFQTNTHTHTHTHARTPAARHTFAHPASRCFHIFSCAAAAADAARHEPDHSNPSLSISF